MIHCKLKKSQYIKLSKYIIKDVFHYTAWLCYRVTVYSVVPEFSYNHSISHSKICHTVIYYQTVKVCYTSKLVTKLRSYIDAVYYTIFRYSSVKVSRNHGMWDRHSIVWNHFMFHSHCMIASQYIVTISKDSQSLIILNSHSKVT